MGIKNRPKIIMAGNRINENNPRYELPASKRKENKRDKKINSKAMELIIVPTSDKEL